MSQLVVTLVAMLLVALASASVGYRMAERNTQQAVIEATQRTIKQANEQSAIDGSFLTEAANRNANEQAKTQIIIKEVTKYVERKRVESPPVDVGHGSCTLDTCRMCLAAEAVHGGDGSLCPCGADGSMPSSKRP